ncbi:ABC transporter ATP-binding protein [Fusibacter paucivorans]|uniref:ABC transporter ATP-binding protein n=1 Tax=Fusibacter paucivorans TaxID=76009 RepID=A0ABS5PR44_9FIRM|nr:ABC transporter ATP-binding protein [Fusibacter paucivorans]MBS7527640.1 ABC transporter ATP-binding protein [Fusibacter paucivorans]
MNPILQVNQLKTSFFTSSGEVEAVRGVSFELQSGEILGIVGESGCGKSVTVKSIMNIIKPPGRVVAGEIKYKDEDLLNLSKHRIREIKGNDIAMIFQDPMTSLNPVLTIGSQLMETMKAHTKLSKSEREQRAIALLRAVQINSPELRLKQYPHEFSGGMRQRVVIAIALANDPDILIADEPTTALDVTIQDQILKLLKDLQKKQSKSVILITHDLGVVAQMCQRVLVMYGGLIVESGTREDIFYAPKHPYTVGLLNAMPKLDSKARLEAIPGSPPALVNPPKGCPFASRCQQAMKICLNHLPHFYEDHEGHKARCWLLDPQVKKMKGYEDQ